MLVHYIKNPNQENLLTKAQLQSLARKYKILVYSNFKWEHMMLGMNQYTIEKVIGSGREAQRTVTRGDNLRALYTYGTKPTSFRPSSSMQEISDIWNQLFTFAQWKYGTADSLRHAQTEVQQATETSEPTSATPSNDTSTQEPSSDPIDEDDGDDDDDL